MSILEAQIAQWRSAVTRNRSVDAADADELESHLREQVTELERSGLAEDEAFLVAVKRLGRVDQITAEYAREHGDRLWKQLVLAGADTGRGRPLVTVIVFALIAAVLVQVARLAATDALNQLAPWVVRDAGFFVLPVLGAWFAWTRRISWRVAALLAGVVVVLAVVVNLYPFTIDGQTGMLAAAFLPLALWFVVGGAYVGGEWRSPTRRMDFVRFTGEWAIYYTLIALGGAVLIGLTSLVLGPIVPGKTIGVIFEWVIPSGAAGAVVVAAWLVEAKKSVIENIAPVLTAIFTPLFAVMLVVSAIGYLVAGIGRSFDRDLLTAFDALLIVVLALVLYGISARDSLEKAGIMDVARLVAMIAAILLDVLVLISMLARVSDYGFTPNRTAALGLNLILLVNLLGSAWLTARLLAGRVAPVRIDRWQTGYLPVFALWAGFVVAVLPLAFGFA